MIEEWHAVPADATTVRLLRREANGCSMFEYWLFFKWKDVKSYYTFEFLSFVGQSLTACGVEFDHLKIFFGMWEYSHG